MGKLGLQYKQIEDILHYIQEHYNESLSLTSLASRVFMSPASFSRIFHKFTELHFSEYIQKIRLEHAAKDLINTNKSMTDIALDNGFSSSAMFSRTFQQYYTITPSQYRKQNSNNYTTTNNNSIEKNKILVDSLKFYPYKKIWNQAINIGETYNLLFSKVQDQTLYLKKIIGFSYVRVWNIFSHKLLLRDNINSLQINFERIDTIFDFLVKNNLHPIIDLSNKSTCVKLDIHNSIYIDTEKIFSSNNEAASIMSSLLQHFVKRYGSNEVNKWIFESWYDIQNINDSIDDYFKIFLDVQHIIKTHIPHAKFGGSGVIYPKNKNSFEYLIKLLSDCKEKPDFISIYIYPYTNSKLDLLQRDTNINFTYNYINECLSIMKENNLSNLPLYITEWNLSVSDRNSFNDSCNKAALTLKHILNSYELASLVIYSISSDLSSNYFDRTAPFYGANGLISKDGLSKPLLYALQFINKMSDYIIEKGDNYLITTDKYGSYDILLFNYAILNNDYYSKKEYEITFDKLNEYTEDSSTLNFSITLNNVANSEYHLRKYTLSPQHGDIISSYKELSVHGNLTLEDINYLNQTCIPKMNTNIIKSINGTLEITDNVNENEIILLTLSPQF